MINLSKILLTTVLSAGIFGAIGQYQPLKAQDALVSPSSKTSTYLTQRSTKLVQEVDTIGITVSDMEQAIAFYTDALSFTKISDVEVYGEEYEKLLDVFGVRLRIVRMQLGDEQIELIQHITPQGEPVPIDSRSNDLWFQHIAIVVSDMEQAYQKLREFNVTHVSTAPQKLPEYIKAAAGIEAFYFRDPDGNTLELIYFPPDKGDPRWQKPTEKVFLGIDHTAIAVSDTETSLKFYQSLLGLEVAGESENYGTEQEHLNNVEGARLRITGLKAPAGMGVEFLEYLKPDNARALPEDTNPQDLVHWETTLVVNNINLASRRLIRDGYRPLSKKIVKINEPTLGFSKAMLVRDPDGHVLRIVEK